MLKIINCYLPLRALLLAELRAAISHLLLLYIYFAYVMMPEPFTLWGVLRNISYWAFMLFFQRRLASGLPLRFTSLRHWRTSPSNFRVTSAFVHSLKDKAPFPAGSIFSGKRPVVVLTGGDGGIGSETAKQLVCLGVDVLVCCLSLPAAESAIANLKARARDSGVDVWFVELDLAEERSIRRCAEAILDATHRIDILINNAGILSDSGPRRANARGDELVVAVNFMGPALLTELLLDRLRASGPARIVNVSSLMQLNANVPDGYTPLTILREHCQPQPCFYARNYSLSKLLSVCYTRDLACRLQGTQVSAITLHPGVVLTGIYNGWGLWASAMRATLRSVFRFPGEGAEVVLYCALAEGVRSGGFYADCKFNDCCLSPLASDETENREITRFIYDHFSMDPKGL